jgi:predicted phage-related endonuclease
MDHPELFEMLDGADEPMKLVKNGATYHFDIYQNTDEWYAARRGMLTASEMSLIITPTLKIAANDKQRAHLWELLAQRITGYVEPRYIGDDMMRGHDDEQRVRKIYAEHWAPVQEVGFVTRDEWGFTIGYSPDGLVGDDGLIEIKSRRQKFQVETILADAAPDEFMIQMQTGLLVTGRAWCDFISYCGGLPMVVRRVLPDPKIQDAIIDAATAFEASLSEKLTAWRGRIAADRRLIPTERVIEQEMYVA